MNLAVDSPALYPNSQEKLETTFEKILFNKKDRFMNGDDRLNAMKALILSSFVFEQPHALLRAIRYLSAVHQ